VQCTIMVIGKAYLRFGALPSFSPIFLHDLFHAAIDGFRFEVFLFLLFGLPIMRYVFLSVVFYLDFNFSFFLFLFPCEMFFIYLFMKVFYKITIYLMKFLLITHPPNWFYQKKPNKPKNNSGGEDTIAISQILPRLS
jgi:hypothetical protein